MKNQKNNSLQHTNSWNWRRKVFIESQYPDLKREFLGYVNEAFYNDENKPFYTDRDIEILKFVFEWIIGIGINLKENKGLLFTGNWGTGKTVIMKGVIQFIFNHYSSDGRYPPYNGISSPLMTSSYNMADYFKDNNEAMINRLRNTLIAAVDDIGKEPREVRYFGTIINPFEKIVSHRFDQKKCLLGTMNGNFDEIGMLYGWATYDRLKEMCYIIPFNGESKRK